MSGQLFLCGETLAYIWHIQDSGSEKEKRIFKREGKEGKKRKKKKSRLRNKSKLRQRN